MRFNVICGLPRSGSTLLCNLLNQNPAFHASSTSSLPQLLQSMGATWSQSPEIQSALHADKQGTEGKMTRAMRAVIREWYADREGHVIFDKSRPWNNLSLLLKTLYPESLMIVCVRDLRGVFGSIEKQHQKFPVLDALTPEAKTLYNRADAMFSLNGLIGQCITGVEDIVRREPQGTIVVRFEKFVQKPERTMTRIYEALDMDEFGHNYDHVENTSEDLDALYNNKFPHEGAGEVKEPDPREWQKYVSPDVAQHIMQTFSSYNQAFNYQ